MGTDGDTGQRPGAAVWNARVCDRGRIDRPTRGGVRETICECSPAHDHSEWRISWRSASRQCFPYRGTGCGLYRLRIGRHSHKGEARGTGTTCHGYSRRRSEEHTSELQSLMRISYAVFCLKKKMKSH